MDLKALIDAAVLNFDPIIDVLEQSPKLPEVATKGAVCVAGGPCQCGERLDAALYRARVEVYQV